MARTVAEIKKTMTDAFMADATIREKYGLKESSTWNGSFSSVSLENIIFFIVAACCHVLESIFELYIKDVDEDLHGRGSLRALVLQDGKGFPVW